jgi:hypothetical protein
MCHVARSLVSLCLLIREPNHERSFASGNAVSWKSEFNCQSAMKTRKDYLTLFIENERVSHTGR